MKKAKQSSPIRKIPEKISVSSIRESLKNVLDPELGVSIVDLGLVYKISVKGGSVKIVMTLTTIGCPLFQTIDQEIREMVGSIPGVSDVVTELTFDPPWNPSLLSDEAKASLGLD